MKHVHFIRGRYVVRVTVPEDLRGIIGKRELAESLDGDKRAAERLAHGVIAGFLDQIEQAREALGANQPTLSSAAKAHYEAELVADDKARAAVGTKAVASLNVHVAPHRASLLRLVAAGEIIGEEAEALIGYAADDLAARGLAPATPRPELLRALAEVQLDALARLDERAKGAIIPGAPQSPLLSGWPIEASFTRTKKRPSMEGRFTPLCITYNGTYKIRYSFPQGY